ncbi:MAG: hypothetical protein FJ387_10400 [Verrucomicrobia bacterium]|nr:hypothetical protein [Verrucomicrobiota bacterium]
MNRRDRDLERLLRAAATAPPTQDEDEGGLPAPFSLPTLARAWAAGPHEPSDGDDAGVARLFRHALACAFAVMIASLAISGGLLRQSEDIPWARSTTLVTMALLP